MPPKQPTQITPKGHEVPIPKRRDVMRDLRRVSVPLAAEVEPQGATSEGDQRRKDNGQ
jgi:hypothetical protein